MKKKFLMVLLTIFVFCIGIVFSACGKIDFKYTIDFVVDGEIVASVGTDSETIAMPKNPTKEGYSFDGWYWDEGKWYQEFTLASIAEQPLQEENNFKVYAKWKSTEFYFVQFSAGSGSGEMQEQKIPVGELTALTKNTFTARKGYIFDGWDYQSNHYDDGEKVLDICEAGETITLYANWREAYYTIKYDANGGTGTMTDRRSQIGYDLCENSAYFEPPLGKIFDSWNTKADGTGLKVPAHTDVPISTKEGDIITLFAQWKTAKYVIKFNANGGSGVMSDETMSMDSELYSYTFENEFTAPNDQKEFSGWNTKADGTGTAITETSISLSELCANGESITLYAQWRFTYYTIHYYSNNGTGEMTTKTVPYYTEESVGAYFSALETYMSIIAWNTKSNGSGQNLKSDEIMFYLRNQKLSNTITLYAQWGIDEAYTMIDISSVEDFALLSGYKIDTIFNLTNDIDCKGASLTPINWGDENFSRGFDSIFLGNGHVISNFTIGSAQPPQSSGEKRFETDYFAGSSFFGNLGRHAQIHRLGLENFTCIGRKAASFACESDGIIKNCYSTGIIIGEDYDSYEVNIGGIVVKSKELVGGGTIRGVQNCYFAGELSGNASTISAFGIGEGDVQNSLFVGSVNLEGDNVSFNIISYDSSYGAYYTESSVLINQEWQTLNYIEHKALDTNALNNKTSYTLETDLSQLCWNDSIWDFTQLDVKNGELPKLKIQTV